MFKLKFKQTLWILHFNFFLPVLRFFCDRKFHLEDELNLILFRDLGNDGESWIAPSCHIKLEKKNPFF